MKPVLNEMDLLRCLTQNNLHAFSQFYSETKFSFIFFTHRRLGDWQESEIIVDNAFIKLWEMRAEEKKEKFEHLLALKKYLFTSCANAITDRRRVKQMIIPVEDVETKFGNISQPASAEKLEAEITEIELFHKLHREIDQLTPDRKKIFQLYLKGLNTAQIAAEMGMSPEAVRNAKFKGLQVLRKNMLAGEFIILLSALNLPDKLHFQPTAANPIAQGSLIKKTVPAPQKPRIVSDINPRMRI